MDGRVKKAYQAKKLPRNNKNVKQVLDVNEVYSRKGDFSSTD